MFWLKNLSTRGIQLANTRCWLINSNCQNTKNNLYLFREIVVKYVLTPNKWRDAVSLIFLEVEIENFIALVNE